MAYSRYSRVNWAYAHYLQLMGFGWWLRVSSLVRNEISSVPKMDLNAHWSARGILYAQYKDWLGWQTSEAKPHRYKAYRILALEAWMVHKVAGSVGLGERILLSSLSVTKYDSYT